MKKVTMIPANTVTRSSDTKLCVAAYCRVSTDSDKQMESLDAQKDHYETLIEANPQWVFKGLYFDEGITGTKKEKRPELRRLIFDCENQEIDLVLTKSISRFARNTADCLGMVRRLLSINVFVYFEEEDINTGSMESELMLSILSGVAEAESASISENGKWSVQRRFQNGSYKIATPPYGYDNSDGKLVVNAMQAEVVRSIFTAVLAGKGCQHIADELNRRGLLTKRNRPWTASTIRWIARNEAYTGDIILQKTYTDEAFLRHANTGERHKYWIRNHHDAIVSREDYEIAQRVIAHRGEVLGIEQNTEKYLCRYPLSGKIICAECGSTFKRRVHSNGQKYIAWSCKTHIQSADQCTMKFIRQADLEYAFCTMMNKLIFGHNEILKPLVEGLRGVKSRDFHAVLKELDAKLKDNMEQQKALVSLLAKKYLEPDVFNQSNNELLHEAERLQAQKELLLNQIDNGSNNATEATLLLRYAMKAAMQKAFDGEIFNRYVNRVVVLSRVEVGFQLNCGLTLRERLDSI
ncbi:MAG: recombinase family protein [Christensenella sp.]|nr:recombinase family protein [Christensenella sp.]